MQAQIKSHIETILEREIVLEKPKDITLGHFATPVAFSLAKEFRKNPMIIAEELASKFADDSIFEEVTAVKGFINFKLSTDYLKNVINNALKANMDFAKPESVSSEKTLLEFVSANPTGPLHIGHARGAIFGDALLKVGRYLGYDITAEYYVNDAGAQMDLLATSLNLAGREYILGEEVEYPEQFYRGEYLIDIAKKCVEKYGESIFHDESRQKELALFAKDEVMQIIVDDLKDLGVIFDTFVSEKSLYGNWEPTKKVLEDNGSLYTKDEKVYLRSTELGDDNDRVVVRDNGIPTYLAGDIIYHKDKYDRNFDKYINIWGADHHGYITRVKAAIKFLGNNPEQLEILLSQMVALLKGGEPYKMSKRAGNVILMSDITKEIGADALRFVFLTKKSDTHLDFDIDVLKAQDSTNPIFYINYAHARVNQLFAKAELKVEDLTDTSIENLNQEGIDLLFQALLLEHVLQDAFAKREVQKITEYLNLLAGSIHKFYNNNKIVGTTNEREYLKVLAMAALSIRVGLNVLGIQAKDKM
jgi:arginyl-tRNA synthetase